MVITWEKNNKYFGVFQEINFDITGLELGPIGHIWYFIPI